MKKNIWIYLCLLNTLILINSCKQERVYKESIELNESDFQNYPIWQNCIYNGLVQMNNDLNITPETYTPYLNNEIINPEQGLYYTKAIFRFNDLTEYNGYVIPIQGKVDSSTIGNLEPTIFCNNKRLTFWNGILTVDSLDLKEFYETIGKSKEEVFPIIFSVDNKIIGRKINGVISGIGYCIDYNCDTIRYVN
ncbi:hypothetical protein DWB61_17795 [Ancylomarina euxinus]|uniref:Uncharacterized protein n=1 Tax=Ancylomarina euxinus TaxID=2283627 RepID=A0A425XW53_9BACT|nr:hypothetical protein [Ancylomarina euxinus]MCZ4696505.1 hypothetical protein [Ancylomarina euxinus]RRG18912.1 hypothetical protein DWB61_17795 [Ancylomarina euxinus]